VATLGFRYARLEDLLAPSATLRQVNDGWAWTRN
jgi:hypothetical protein